ncbi:LysR family transcriptional regulator [Lysobacter maris]|uniref:LysR family transcriptional regulator n=1 Tax=Marilutibacter maris TaxID=1605891 RepID=A0A508AUD3_9GAMM|nr:LysR family transcriptional regulator [Lysobacter maris]KAB8189702.1 LysR family transcriptional regulator [Lysobacter maris]
MRKSQTNAAAGSVGLDDLRLLLAIAATGSLGGAARQLGVDHSSAFRRLGALEQRIGARLFDRARRGYTATAAGEIAIAAAGRIGEELDSLDRRLLGEDLRLSGPVRVTTTDTLLHIVAPLFAQFREREPGIVVEVAAGNALFDLSRRDADLAIRPVATVPEHLIARPVATVAIAPYASADYLARAGERPLAGMDWIAPDDSLSHVGSARWIAAHVAPARIVHRADSLLALMHAARAGIGVTALPCYLGDCEPGLRRAGALLEDAAVPLWLLTHPDLRPVRRIRALSEFLFERLREQQALFSGQRPAPA